MGADAWEELRDDLLDRQLWWSFEQRFRLKLDYQRGTSPAIAEPDGSVTLDLSPIFQARDYAEYEAGASIINNLVLESFRYVFDVTARLVVLDWQHPTYWFWPHRLKGATVEWQVPPFPDGDYHVFLSDDLSQGTFGHPWEQTLCVFGADLVRDLVPKLVQRLPVKRRSPE